jgi:hypothetical protein
MAIAYFPATLLLQRPDTRPLVSFPGGWRPFVPRDEWGNRIEKIDLLALAKEKRAEQVRVQVENVPVSFNRGSSLAVRGPRAHPREWARL